MDVDLSKQFLENTHNQGYHASTLFPLWSKLFLSVRELYLGDIMDINNINYIGFSYDYEEVSSDAADKVMSGLRDLIMNPSIIGKAFNGEFEIRQVDDFCYVDPIDKSVAKKQVSCILKPYQSTNDCLGCSYYIY